MGNCPVCNTETHITHLSNNDMYKVSCLRCGIFLITDEAKLELQSTAIGNRVKANFSNWLSNNEQYEISSLDLVNLLNLSSPSFIERSDSLLKFIAKSTHDNLGRSVNFRDPMNNKIDQKWVSKSSSVDDSDLLVIIEYLEKLERIIKSYEGREVYKILPSGWIRLEELSKVNIDSTQAFVAMWFDDVMGPIYENIMSKAICEAGYKPLKIDNKLHNNKICDEIIAEIRKSKFLVADLTGHRGGVYYEAGFAKGLGLEVFWSCNEKDFDKLHFDIRQYNCIKWSHDNLERFKNDLRNRIESVLGHGPHAE